MTQRLTNKEIADIVEREGLAYAIQDYLDPERINSPMLKMWWITAAGAMKEINEILSEHRE